MPDDRYAGPNNSPPVKDELAPEECLEHTQKSSIDLRLRDPAPASQLSGQESADPQSEALLNTIAGSAEPSPDAGEPGMRVGRGPPDRAIFNLNGTVWVTSSTLANNLTQLGQNLVELETAGLMGGGALYNLSFGHGSPTAAVHLANSILANSRASAVAPATFTTVVDLVSDNQQGREPPRLIAADLISLLSAPSQVVRRRSTACSSSSDRIRN